MIEYDRAKAINYAYRFYNSRNPKYYDFEHIGGDCTNFVSQCLIYGNAVMNVSPLGWYYYSLDKRSASFTSVEYFYKFITSNSGRGPFGKEVDIDEVEVGDIVQLDQTGHYNHTLLITKLDDEDIYLTAHTFDVKDKPLKKYFFNKARFIKILGIKE